MTGDCTLGSRNGLGSCLGVGLEDRSFRRVILSGRLTGVFEVFGVFVFWHIILLFYYFITHIFNVFVNIQFKKDYSYLCTFLCMANPFLVGKEWLQVSHTKD